ncbi:MAG: hypothetical protein Q9220_005993 [cf. Caloplaca sp. 1 TL-2023]
MVIPGGMIKPPSVSPVVLIDATIRPRKFLYLDGETLGSFIVDAAVRLLTSYILEISVAYTSQASYTYGRPYGNAESSIQQQTELRARANSSISPANGDVLTVRIFNTDSGVDIIPRASINFKEIGREYAFPLSAFKPSSVVNRITLELTKSSGAEFTATTNLFHLPEPVSPQSVSRIDSLSNGLEVRAPDSADWTPIFPFSYYVSGAWLASDPSNLRKFAEQGYNILHIVPGGEGIGYDLDQLDAWFDEAEKLGLWIMHDMRWTYQNEAYLRQQVQRYRLRKNMLFWYTSDEPDGHEDPPDAPSKAYNIIKFLDPYHPVSLCLNCQNYYFESYSSGADILLADVYPIGTNTSFSNKYHTPCNTTHGDCGCDNCISSPDPADHQPPLANIPARFTLWSQFQTQLRTHKPVFSVPQAFPAQDFWQATPTPNQVTAMILLGINNGARGILGWLFPTDAAIEGVTSRLSKVILGSDGMAPYLLGGTEVRVLGGAVGSTDVRAWRVGGKGDVLVSVVFMWEQPFDGGLRLEFQDQGFDVRGVGRMLWGSEGWMVDGRDGVRRVGLGKEESWVFLVEVEDGVATA